MSNRHAPRRIVLIGLPGSGKSAVARQLARRLGPGWRAFDTDEVVVSSAGRSIPEIFDAGGEEEFRALEQAAIMRHARSEFCVIATGGGAILRAENRRLLWQNSLVVHLAARPETLVKRVTAQGSAARTRPLLAGGELKRLRDLQAERRSLYDLADQTVQTDGLFPDQIAEVVFDWHHRFGEQLIVRPGREDAWSEPAPDESGLAATVTTPNGSYGIYVGSGELARLGERMAAAGLRGRPTVIADERVAALYGEYVLSALRGAGFEPRLLTMPSGESNKHLATVSALYDRLVGQAERGDPIVALGGGVATDLAGFVAASYLRGVPLVHVPTSLLAMMDAAIGGKVGVDHARGKNLVGAFYQPRLVVCDADVLGSLPARERTEGWAEVIKHALIRDEALLERLERDSAAIAGLEPAAILPVLRRSAQLKAAVVSADEREAGLRLTLNYGHTIGHAIEAATGYSAVLHGEAVAVGMQGAARIAVELGVLAQDAAERQQRVIQRYGLPTRWPGVDVQSVLASLRLDKKVVASKQRWVLLREIGRTVIRDDVPPELVREVVTGLLTP